MNTKPLEKFAQNARRQLHEQVRARLEQVLRTDSPELRARAAVVAELNKQIAQSSRQEVVERVAYTWFNRFCALRYMDANHYTRVGVLSPAPGSTQPEILQEAKAGHIDDELPLTAVQRQHITDLLNGRTPAPDPQTEAYRLLLVAACNQYHPIMPFLFEKIDDYTELLMPDDLLSARSVLAGVRDALTVEACQDVEVLGWLYQFYISEKKNEVIGAKKPISPENIPAATQLFTPDWIVRYLVQNALGRLWLSHRPHSRLAEQMEFYIRPDETSDFSEKSDVWRITSPEDLTLCDPAVGSGHMLTYAFDLLYAIYEEEGYNPPDIRRLILEKNLTGLEIDERAAALAAFALMMKARGRDRRFFKRGVFPAITVLRPIAFTDEELTEEVNHLLDLSFRRVFEEESLRDSRVKGIPHSADSVRNDTAAARRDIEDGLRHDLNLFRAADNAGSLLRPRLSAAHLAHLHDHLNAPADTGQLSLFHEERRKKARQAIAQAIPLAHRYHVVIANPPYMGSKNMNDDLKRFAEANYPDSKSDFFAMFIERGFDLVASSGYNAMVTMQSWMFLSSYEKLREKLLNSVTIDCMVHMDNMVMGIAFGTAATVWQKAYKPDFKGHFSYVYYEDLTPENRPREFPMQNERLSRASAADFQKIPGSPIAYWVSNKIRKAFSENQPLQHLSKPKQGMATGDNERFTRVWHEVPLAYSKFTANNLVDAAKTSKKWFPYNKGGEFRKWYGNGEYVVNWANDGKALKEYASAKHGSYTKRIVNMADYFQPAISWSKISSGNLAMRFYPHGYIFDVAGCSIFSEKQEELLYLLGLMNTYLVRQFLASLSPTLNFEVGQISQIPVLYGPNFSIGLEIRKLVDIAKLDWDSYETSWDFSSLPLLQARQSGASLAAAYAALRQQWQAATLEMQRLEEENNRLFIAAYGLQDELTPDVPLAEITLTCNPHYRYGSNPLSVDGNQLSVIGNRWPEVAAQWPEGDEGREVRLLADTMREFVSYAVGCMFGRYSLDAPGLILANQGETLDDYLHAVSFPRKRESTTLPGEDMDAHFRGHDIGGRRDTLQFLPDKDNAIPMLDGEWFSDDITERFKKFLRVTFGEAHYTDNLAFIEAALGRDIRSYFLRDFYDHHVRMYKKRPIYWLFSSPKGSFNVLIYLHRYRPDTVSVVLNDYLREFRAKLTAHKSHLESVSISSATSARDKTRALKEVGDLEKVLKEIQEYEDEVLYPLATRQVQLDLDDGVKVNYNKLGSALKKVTGLTE